MWQLLEVHEQRNADLVQESDDFDTVYFKQAPEAQQKLMALVAEK